MNQKKKNYSVKLEPSTINSIKRIAAQQGLKPAAFIRSILEDRVLSIEDPQAFMNKTQKEIQENLRKLREINNK